MDVSKSPSSIQPPADCTPEIPARDPQTGEILTYTPGYVPHKIAMIGFGLVLFCVGFAKLGPIFNLMIFGSFAQAEAFEIIKERQGRAPETLRSDADWKVSEDNNDHDSVYWNIYRLNLPEKTGESVPASVTFRAPVGSAIKPAHPLLDADGLPTMIPVFYNPKDPAEVVLPAELSTWFFPGVMFINGLVGMVVGGMLLYAARRPIPLPQIVDASGPPPA